MRKIFVINGLPESGKTTFGRLVGEDLARRGINFIHTSSIDPVKQVLLPKEKWEPEMQEGVKGGILLLLKRKVTDKDWDGHTKDDYWRKVMSDVKREITQWNPYLIPYFVLAKIETLAEPYVAFVDIREPENIIAFKEQCHARRVSPLDVGTVLVESDCSKRSNNRSDESVHEFEYDYVIKNDRREYMGGQEGLGLRILADRARRFIDLAVIDTKRGPEII